MTRKHTELEAEFLADLATRTGRDLSQWMAAIDAAGLTDKNGLADKNAIIDWLRPQGLTFAHASWLERIHNNDGRPIYVDQPARPGRAPPLQPMAAPRSPAPAPAATPATTPAPLPAQPGATDPDLIKQLLAGGKAFRPLAEFIIAELRRALPEVVLNARDDLIVFARPLPFAVLWVSPKELRFALDLADRPFDTPLLKAKVPGAAPRFTHMLVLNDARQVGPALIELAKLSDQRANPQPPAPHGV